MSDIQPGDLVVCVKRGAWIYYSHNLPPDNIGPTFGEVLRVEAVESTEFGPSLVFLEWLDTFHISRFRKLNDEPDNAKIVEMIKRPIRIPVEVA